MLRVHHEVVNQVYGPYRTGNLFAGSVLFLEPATIYEIRFTMSDPDGGAPAKPKIVSATTRAEPRAFKGGHTIKGSADKGLLAAFKEAKPGDVILLAPGIYKGPFDLKKSGTAERPIVIPNPNQLTVRSCQPSGRPLPSGTVAKARSCSQGGTGGRTEYLNRCICSVR